MSHPAIRATALTLAAAMLLCACAGNRPLVHYDPGADFQAYRSYAFISEHPMLRTGDAQIASPLLEARLMRIASELLEAEGYRRVDDPRSADFTIGFTVGSREHLDVTSYPEPYRPYYSTWGWGAGYYGARGIGNNSTSQVAVTQYTEGVLAVDIYDVAGHKPVWHGVAKGRITASMRRNPGRRSGERGFDRDPLPLSTRALRQAQQQPASPYRQRRTSTGVSDPAAVRRDRRGAAGPRAVLQHAALAAASPRYPAGVYT